ncbi:FTR1 family protein Ecym_6115 [Eremothecium cymbalariae DBVPG|uniref:Plasma membrane iron permease n=1 Tax=Eremothecium cymbalariae (strain CBS 270.75 / DBVPG 7215 / KCTC 17166 / NRRL Y-17582) TaxID=931890 RepID=G8JV29_ERECY|nr:hypothetical protein Ecym_6115 [Eremothecium cymbalariae DBVPG\
MASNKVFNVAIFFVVFRECLEAAMIVSVLLSFLKQAIGKHEFELYKKLRLQVWLGVVAGFVICLAVGGAMIGVYYRYENDIYSNSEDLWEAVFCFLATIMISLMGISMLRINKMQTKWRVKIAQALLQIPEKARDRYRMGYLLKKYAMFFLPFVTVLREGLEAVVFVAGVGPSSRGAAATSYPLPVIVGLLAGFTIGALLYYGTSHSSMQVFLVISTCILYLISAGLFSRGAWYLETYRYNKATGGDASESGSGNGSYNIKKAVYHVNCCNPEIENGWDIFNALLGWQNTGYLASILCYILYWVALIFIVSLMIFEEKRGHLPFLKNKRMSDFNPFRKMKKKQDLSVEDKTVLFSKVENLNFNNEGQITSKN